MFNIFDAVIKTIDRVDIKLKERQDREAKFFTEFLEPFFNEFEQAAQNYIKYFYTLEEIILSSEDWSESIKKLKDGREEFRAKRVKILASLEAVLKPVREDLDKEEAEEDKKIVSNGHRRDKLRYKEALLREFMLAVMNFFWTKAQFLLRDCEEFPSIAEIVKRDEEYFRKRSRTATVIHLFQFLDCQDVQYTDEKNQARREELARYIARVQGELERHWYDANKYYQELKLLYYQPEYLPKRHIA